MEAFKLLNTRNRTLLIAGDSQILFQVLTAVEKLIFLLVDHLQVFTIQSHAMPLAALCADEATRTRLFE